MNGKASSLMIREEAFYLVVFTDVAGKVALSSASKVIARRPTSEPVIP